jgi:phospholipid/cholesterol/gamma-HCH transport system permease protein
VEDLFSSLNFFKIFFYLRDLAQIILTGLYDFFLVLLTRRNALPLFFNQILFSGLDALPILTIVSFLVGMGTVAEAGIELPKLGVQNLVGPIILHIILRIVGPFTTALIVTARTASSLTVEIGNMRISGELDTIEMMGANISYFLLAPRLFGAIISTVALSLYFAVIAFFGGLLIAFFGLSMPIVSLIRELETSINLPDLIIPLVESITYGSIIAAVGSYHGLKVGDSPTDVPQQTTRALVSSIVLCTLFSTFFLVFSSVLF